ncbi:ATP-binding protein [Vulcanisaeta thermophila]|uniref:ATP-binding protein n=1 Tax=Vulcanisaeta thermophila TaxID=867917 RepID=UPI000853D41E|nr:ATP-binding protein [Vulcanisaeta thermophila]
MGRIKLSFAGVHVDFVDRDRALRRVEEWAREGMVKVQVVYGPEGCGKTAWLRQSVELLRGLGFDVVYVNPINREFLTEVHAVDLRDRFLAMIREAISQDALGRLVWLTFDVAKELIRVTRGRIAVIVDDAFQVIGARESALYVKALLNLIEYPPEHYEKIITIAATSEGVSRGEIGRHRWASIRPLWNMAMEGFRQLYDQVPGVKPDFEEAWGLTGGNPKMLEELYKARWDVNEVLRDIIETRGLRKFIESLSGVERRWLQEAVDDPDTLFVRERMSLLEKLVELNLVLDNIPDRDVESWIDEPPPERYPELGIGRRVAWQSPLHREAVKRVLEG